ncbi:MAG: hypothetical protein HY720_20625, partial [Planctomycetes bacterium]|nr:hypothetical protein [Planctomycetota bacterium]
SPQPTPEPAPPAHRKARRIVKDWEWLHVEAEILPTREGHRVVVRGEARLPPHTVIGFYFLAKGNSVCQKHTTVENGAFQCELPPFEMPLFPGKYQLRVEIDTEVQPFEVARELANLDAERLAKLVDLEVDPARRDGLLVEAEDELESAVQLVRQAARTGPPLFTHPDLMPDKKKIEAVLAKIAQAAGGPVLDLRYAVAPLAESRQELRAILADPTVGTRAWFARLDESLDRVLATLWRESIEEREALAEAIARAATLADPGRKPHPREGPEDIATTLGAWLLARELASARDALEAETGRTQALAQNERQTAWLHFSAGWLGDLYRARLTARRLGLPEAHDALLALASLWNSRTIELGLVPGEPVATLPAEVAATLAQLADESTSPQAAAAIVEDAENSARFLFTRLERAAGRKMDNTAWNLWSADAGGCLSQLSDECRALRDAGPPPPGLEPVSAAIDVLAEFLAALEESRKPEAPPVDPAEFRTRLTEALGN